MTKLTRSEVEEKIEKLNGWSISGDTIKKIFKFENFLESIDFVNKVAPEAESMQHHPDICIKYNTVDITLTTHDEDGVTEKDFKLAAILDNLST